jgi:hypothetical protein
MVATSHSPDGKSTTFGQRLAGVQRPGKSSRCIRLPAVQRPAAALVCSGPSAQRGTQARRIRPVRTTSR